jgi:hypothetical protein
MGANAQTAVPVFTAGQVLTAQQQTEINTGVPVFATTVTRDAAFGGAGEKTLAEGQFAYIEATNTTQYYDGAAWQSVAGSSGVVQVKNAFKADAFSTTSGTYVDVTDLSISITPTLNTNKVLVIMTVQGSQVTGNGGFQLIRGATAIGVSTVGSTFNGAGIVSSSYGNSAFTIGLAFLDSPATTSATTYKVQAIASGGTTYVNRRAADTLFGGSSSITVMEVTP